MSPALVGLGLGVGLLLVLDGLTSRPRFVDGSGGRDVAVGVYLAVGLAAVVAAAVVWFTLGIAVVAVGAGCAVIAARWLWSRDRGRSLSDVAELAEVVARWLENVNDKVRSASHTVESALLASATEVEGRFAPEFHSFAEDMRAYGLDAAGRDLCAKLNHPLADKAVVSLISSRESGGVPIEALAALADAAQAEMNNARRLEAQLARSATSAQLVTLFGLGLAVLAVVLFRENLAIYRSAPGQVVLLIGLVLVGASLWKVWDLSRVPPAQRFLRLEGGDRR